MTLRTRLAQHAVNPLLVDWVLTTFCVIQGCEWVEPQDEYGHRMVEHYCPGALESRGGRVGCSDAA